MNTLTKPANAAFFAALVMFAALCGAWYFQYQLGYAPCPLCYQQRIPYYFAIPLGLVLAAQRMPPRNRAGLFEPTSRRAAQPWAIPPWRSGLARAGEAGHLAGAAAAGRGVALVA